MLAACETLYFLECSSHRMVSFLGAQWQRLILEEKKAKESNFCVYSASKGMDSGSGRGAEEIAGTGLAELTPYTHSSVILEGQFSPSVTCPFPCLGDSSPVLSGDVSCWELFGRQRCCHVCPSVLCASCSGEEDMVLWLESQPGI